jgi:hypothetical protein
MFAGTFQRATASRSSRARYTADRGAAKCLVILVVVMAVILSEPCACE